MLIKIVFIQREIIQTIKYRELLENYYLKNKTTVNKLF